MEPIVHSLVQTFMQICLGLNLKAEDPVLRQVAEAVYRKIMASPTILRWSMRVLLLFFNGYGYITTMTAFTGQNDQQRQRQVKQWQTRMPGPCRQLMVFFEKMTVFIYYSL